MGCADSSFVSGGGRDEQGGGPFGGEAKSTRHKLQSASESSVVPPHQRSLTTFSFQILLQLLQNQMSAHSRH